MVRVAVLSRDAATVADVRRLVALAGADTDVVASASELTRAWRSAHLVVVDVAMADLLSGADLPTRPGVLLVAAAVDRVDVWRAAARAGARDVMVLPADQQKLVDVVTLAGDAPGTPGRVVGVWPGHGGAGASVLATGLAVFAGDVAPVTLVDADPAGGGLDLLLGAERVDGLRWSDLAGVRGVVSARSVCDGLPTLRSVRLLSHSRDAVAPVPPPASTAVLSALRRADPVVVDLPGGLDAGDGAAGCCDVIVVVVATEVRGVAAASLAVRAAVSCCDEVRLVVRQTDRARLRPPEVGAALGLPVTAVLPSAAGVAAAADRGELATVVRKRPLAAPLRRLTAQLLDRA